MSLSSILTIASAGISNADYQIALANGNIANASDTSYSRKTASFSTVTETLALSTATTTRVADAYLTRATAQGAATSAQDAAVSASLQSYDAALGTVAGGDDVSSLITALQTSLTSLTSTGATAASKSAVVSSASNLASTIQGLSSTIQTLRTQANSDIATTVGTINTAADSIADLNNQISSTAATGGDTTSLEDQRAAAVQTLAGAMGVSYFTTPDNRVQVFTPSGDLLVGATANHLAYTTSSALSATTTYPGQVSGILLNGKDVTASLTGGKLGGLIQVRDTSLVGEQAKLDQLAGTLITAANAAANSGSAYPAPSVLTGSTTVAASDAFTGTGTLRVALTSSTGAVVASQDIDLSAMATVSDLVTALNGVPGLSASVSSAGKLVVAATATGQGVAFADLGASVDPAGSGVADHFGFNDLFSGAGAADIAVSTALQTNPAGLPTAALNGTSSLAVGAIGLASADSAVAGKLLAALSDPVTMPAAGDFATQSINLQTYATNFVSGAATLAANASAKADASTSAYTAAKTRLENLTTVNTDQELALLTTYQQQYQANAQMVAVVRTLFNSLITMMA
jgi:flagellar hook-associated protein 1 FlgK